MIWRKKGRKPNFQLGPWFRENGGQNAHCRPKMRFFAVSMATEDAIENSKKRTTSEHACNVHAKFRSNPFTRLGVGRSQTNKQTSQVATRISAYCEERQVGRSALPASLRVKVQPMVVIRWNTRSEIPWNAPHPSKPNIASANITTSKFKGCQSTIFKRYRKSLNTFMKQNFLLYTTVLVNWIYDEQCWSSSAFKKLCRKILTQIASFDQVAMATVHPINAYLLVWWGQSRALKKPCN